MTEFQGEMFREAPTEGRHASLAKLALVESEYRDRELLLG